MLEKVLDQLYEGLYEKTKRPGSASACREYIQKKVQGNLRIIEEKNKDIKMLERNSQILVNGRSLHTLKFYSEMLSEENLMAVFAEDTCADIHGDLTVENIVCLCDQSDISPEDYQGAVQPQDYYLIDPNTGNVHESPFLDYGKLLQSLHGKYEFLCHVRSVQVQENSVNYMVTSSDAYCRLYEAFHRYLHRKFTPGQIRSIYYHEVIHWLRLMPYKIRKDEKLAVVFYTGLLTVLNDVWEMDNGYKKESGDL